VAGYRKDVFNYGWITLLVMFIIVVIGGLYEALGRPDKKPNQQSLTES
jgi:hypothetical protein